MSLPRILVVDDQFARNATERFLFLRDTGLAHGEVGGGIASKPYAEVTFCSGQREEGTRLVNDYFVVRAAIAAGEWALVLLDVQFDSGERDADGQPAGQPGDDLFGVTIRQQLREDFPDLPVAMLTSKRQNEIGETDTPYLSKHKLGSYELRRLLLRLGRMDAAASRTLLGLDTRVCADDPASLAAFRQAFVHAGTNVSVLILGESGVGKEVVARYVHRLSARSSGPFVAVNVAAIPRDLVEADLFGIGKRVASSVDARQGKFELASGGTLFLDEIGDMPMDVQAKVLRALQERKIVRVGEAEEISVDIRLICATSRDLASRVKSGNFRSDLLYRINTVPIIVPPLRERTQDIAPLARRFLDEFAARQGKSSLLFSADALAVLEAQTFPGNVRELENLVEHLASAAGHHQILGRDNVLEALGSKSEPLSATQPLREPPASLQTLSEADIVPRMPSLGILADWLDRVSVDKDDPALKGIKPKLDAATLRLSQRLVGAALERCRDPNDNTLNRQSSMRLLTGDGSLKGKGPARIVNEILGRAQEQPVTEEDLESLVNVWRNRSHE
jgi:DNA-binding NtrC family response regulator